jgi:trehalose 2-sulfotransferase
MGRLSQHARLFLSRRVPPPSRPAATHLRSEPEVPWSAVEERLVASGKLFYCICFSHRSGSTLLCNDMRQWGFGAPHEHFQFPVAPVLEGPLWDHLARMAEQWDGDFIGVKIGWYQATEVTSRLRVEGYESIGFHLGNIFPGLRYIHIVRRDKIGQAISAWRAETSGTWHRPTRSDADPGRPPYDFDAIRLRLQRLVAEDWLWQWHFEHYGITPLTIYYEDYVQDRPGHLARIAEHLDVTVAPVPLVDRTEVMRDEWTDQIAERVIADLHRPF